MRLVYIMLNLLLFGISTHDSALQQSDVVVDAFSERQADVDANANANQPSNSDQFDQKVDTSLIKLTPAIITAKLGIQFSNFNIFHSNFHRSKSNQVIFNK